MRRYKDAAGCVSIANSSRGRTLTSDFRDHIKMYHREEYVKVENEEAVLKKKKRQQDRKRRNHIKALVSPVAGPSKQ